VPSLKLGALENSAKFKAWALRNSAKFKAWALVGSYMQKKMEILSLKVV